MIKLNISPLKGTAEMSARLKELAAKFPQRVMGAVDVVAELKITKAKERTPVDTTKNAPHPGQLRDSGFAQPAVMEGNKIVAVLSFGGLADAYAVYVHEIPPDQARHPIGGWKYLESVLNEDAPKIAGEVADVLEGWG